MGGAGSGEGEIETTVLKQQFKKNKLKKQMQHKWLRIVKSTGLGE